MFSSSESSINDESSFTGSKLIRAPLLRIYLPSAVSDFIWGLSRESSGRRSESEPERLPERFSALRNPVRNYGKL